MEHMDLFVELLLHLDVCFEQLSRTWDSHELLLELRLDWVAQVSLEVILSNHVSLLFRMSLAFVH